MAVCLLSVHCPFPGLTQPQIKPVTSNLQFPVHPLFHCPTHPPPTCAHNLSLHAASVKQVMSGHRTGVCDLAGKAFSVSSDWKWFEEQVGLAQIELEAADESEVASEI